MLKAVKNKAKITKFRDSCTVIIIYNGIIVLAQKLMLAIQHATNTIQTLSKENNNIPNAMLENITIFDWLLTIVVLNMFSFPSYR